MAFAFGDRTVALSNCVTGPEQPPLAEPAFIRGVGVGDLQRPLPTSVIL